LPVPERCAVGVHIWFLEQSELELGAQHVSDSRVDHRRGDESASIRVEIWSMLLVRRLKDHVEARVQRARRCGGCAGLRVMQHRRAACRRRRRR
jgi:hypothetical protein